MSSGDENDLNIRCLSGGSYGMTTTDTAFSGIIPVDLSNYALNLKGGQAANYSMMMPLSLAINLDIKKTLNNWLSNYWRQFKIRAYYRAINLYTMLPQDALSAVNWM